MRARRTGPSARPTFVGAPLFASSLAALTAFTLAQPARAQQCRSVPECLAFAGLTTGKVDSLFALVTAAVAAPVILTGAVITAAGQVRAEQQRREPINLALIPVPEPQPPPAEPTSQELRNREKQRRVVQVNDALTNVGIAVGGAAVLGSIIYGIANAKHK